VLPLDLWKVVVQIGLTELNQLDSPDDLTVRSGAPRFTSTGTSPRTPTTASTPTPTSTTGGTGLRAAPSIASSLTTADHIAAFFERNKAAIIATGAVLTVGGGVAIYLSTREGEDFLNRGRERGQEFLNRGRERGQELLSRGRERGQEFLDRGRERGREFLDRGRERGRELLSRGRERG
jgi:hypothetical protein